MAKTSQVPRFMGHVVICALLVIGGCTEPGPQANEPNVVIRVEPAPGPQQVDAPAPQPPIGETAQPQPPSPPKQTFALALKFTAQDAIKYHLIADAGRSVQWLGPAEKKPSAFKGGYTGNRLEMVFTQRVKKVDDKGNAVAEITIESLKYLGKGRDSILVDFDSSRQEDQNEPTAKLIGQTYSIEVSAIGQVLRIVDVNQAQAAIGRVSPGSTTALQLLAAEAIRERHTVAALGGCEGKLLTPGDTWSNIRTFSFGMMGTRSHERVYTFKEVAQVEDHQIAIIDMNAIPSSQPDKERRKDDTIGIFTKMFDSTETYTGRLKLDLSVGRIEEYIERLDTEWVAAEPATEGSNEQPAALKMAATRFYHIERIPEGGSGKESK